MLKGLRYSALSPMLASMFMFLAGPVWAQPAPDANSVIVLASIDPASYYAGRLTSMGFTVVSATDPQWAARTTADFATFRAIVIPDPDCGGAAPAAAVANAATWAAAANGPKLLIGTDEYFHLTSGGSTFIDKGLGYVTSGGAGKTGLYLSLSCYYNSSGPTAPPIIGPLGTSTVEGNLGCYNDAHIVAIHPALTGSTDATLSNWSCSVHEVFRTIPPGFIPLAIARNITGVGAMTFGDGTHGVPYILASGGGIIAVGAVSNNIPTMSEWALILMGALLAISAFVFLRRRRR